MKSKVIVPILVVLAVLIVGLGGTSAYFFVQYNTYAEAIDNYQETIQKHINTESEYQAINKTLEEKNDTLTNDVNTYKERLQKKTEDFDVATSKVTELNQNVQKLENANKTLSEHVAQLTKDRNKLIEKYQKVTLSGNKIVDYTSYHNSKYYRMATDGYWVATESYDNGIYNYIQKAGEMSYDSHGRKQWLDGCEISLQIFPDDRYIYQDVSVKICYAFSARNIITGEHEWIYIYKTVQLPQSGAYSETFNIKQFEMNGMRYVITEESEGNAYVTDCSGTVTAK